MIAAPFPDHLPTKPLFFGGLTPRGARGELPAFVPPKNRANMDVKLPNP